MKRVTGRQIPHDVLEHYRFRAIELWEEGEQIKQIAHFFGLHRVTVSYWIAAYKKGGKDALKSKKASGPQFRLSEEEIDIIIDCLKRPATDFGFDTPLWTTKRVVVLIKEKTGKSIHYSNVWRMLRRLGLTNQKPERRAIEQNPEEAERWIEEEWPKIQAHAKRWQAMLYFHDEAGISLIPFTGKTWAPKGETPIVRVTGKKGGFCFSSAISLGGRMLFRVEKKRVNAERFIDFLKKIMKHHPNRKVIVVTDRAPVHTAKAVERFVAENSKRFALYYLPPYSPELNPDEQVWSHLKTKKLNAHTATSLDELKSIAKASMHSIQKQPLLIQSFFHKLR